MSNAFTTTGPSTIKLRQKSVKQMRRDATRKNSYEPLCIPVPAEKAQKLRKTTI